MRREEAVAKAERVVEAVRAGRVPYRVLQVVLYGSAARGDPNPNDVDLYIQLEVDSVPFEDTYREITYGGKGGVGEKLRKALKLSKGERVSIIYDFVPWDQHVRLFVKPEEVDKVAQENIARLDLNLKTHRQAKRRIEKSAAKRHVKPFGWPPEAIVLYLAEPGKPA